MQYDLQARLIDFAVVVLNLSEQLPAHHAGSYFSGQMIRSGCAPALLYGEAQSAESRRDFIHKMKVALKELRETYISLTIISKKNYTDGAHVQHALKHNNELISIFVASIKTAEQNNRRKHES